METIREQTMNKDLVKKVKSGLCVQRPENLPHTCPLCGSGKWMNVQCIRFITVQ